MEIVEIFKDSFFLKFRMGYVHIWWIMRVPGLKMAASVSTYNKQRWRLAGRSMTLSYPEGALAYFSFTGGGGHRIIGVFNPSVIKCVHWTAELFYDGPYVWR